MSFSLSHYFLVAYNFICVFDTSAYSSHSSLSRAFSTLPDFMRKRLHPQFQGFLIWPISCLQKPFMQAFSHRGAFMSLSNSKTAPQCRNACGNCMCKCVFSVHCIKQMLGFSMEFLHMCSKLQHYFMLHFKNSQFTTFRGSKNCVL